MIVIRPNTVTDATLVSSNVAEADYAEWLVGTAYVTGERVIKDHKIYEAAQANSGKDPTDPANTSGTTPYWFFVSATNRWKMFDTSADTQTENAESITVTVSGRADSLHLVNIEAATAHVEVVVSGDTKFEADIDLVVNNVYDLWTYFFEPVIRKTDAVVLKMPPYASAEITVTLSSPGGTVKCGALVLGMSRDLGETQWEPEARGLSFATKARNRWGDTTLTPGKNARLLSCSLFVDNKLIDETRRLLESYDGVALSFIGSQKFTSANVFGFYRDFRAVIESPAGSWVNLEIEEFI